MTDSEPKFTLMGKDLEKVPCFKSSFLTGTLGGMGLGLAHFLFTSRVKRSSDVAAVSFTIITFGYWCYCRYHWSSMKFSNVYNADVLQDVALKGVVPPDSKYSTNVPKDSSAFSSV